MSTLFKGILVLSLVGNLLAAFLAWKALVWRSELHARTADLRSAYARWAEERRRIERDDARSLAFLGVRPDAIFLGASIERDWPLPDSFPGKPYLNRGRSGDTTGDMLARLDTSALALRPRVLVIGGGGGVNRIGAGEPDGEVAETIARDTREMVARARARQIRVVVLSILPTGSKAEGAYRRNDQIARANALLRQIPGEDAGVRFVDVATLVSGPDGRVRDDLVTDGLHLTPAGYRILTAAVQPVLEEMVAASREADPPSPAGAAACAKDAAATPAPGANP